MQKRIINIAHKQGHLGTSKTKEMIRNKYWSPLMNINIENIVQPCFSCQIAANSIYTEPAKMTTIPQQPWEVVELNFCGPVSQRRIRHGTDGPILSRPGSRIHSLDCNHTAMREIEENICNAWCLKSSTNGQWSTV